MNFISTLEAHKLDYVLEDQQFRPIVPMNGKKFADLLKRITEDNLSVFIDYDCDPDGYFACLALVETFKLLGFTNYKLTRHAVKRHSLSVGEVSTIYNGHYDVVFILDSSSNDLDTIQTITNSGAICCVIDHHESHYMFEDYPASAIIINPLIDAMYKPACYSQLSAGAITSVLCAYTLLSVFRVKPPTDLFLYGIITLYSDIMDMDNSYNIAYITRYQNTTTISSKLIKLFWDQYSHFDKSYISFKLIPRLNALFRTEDFDILYKLFFEPETTDYDAIRTRIEEHYKTCKVYVERLVSSCEITEYDNIILAVMRDANETYSRNFTGLVASKIASEYNRPVLCMHPTSPTEWQGSVRDNLSRNLLTIFRPMCYAEGHKSAFGIKIPVAELKCVLSFVNEELENLTESRDAVIILNWDDNSNFAADIPSMAQYNEFGGQGLPVAMGALTIKPRYKIYRDDKKITVYGDGQKFICCVPTLDVGDVMLVKPTLSGASYTNFVNTVHLS